MVKGTSGFEFRKIEQLTTRDTKLEMIQIDPVR